LTKNQTMALDQFYSEVSPRNPHIHFDPVAGLLELKGKSVPENPVAFYTPVIDWLNKYIEAPAGFTTFNIQLEYFNTSSSKFIVDMLKKLDLIKKENKGELEVNWLYDKYDEDMMESGEDMNVFIKSGTFKMIPYIKVD